MDDDLSEIDSNNIDEQNKKNYPILAPSGKENYRKKENEEETKEMRRENRKNKKNANSNYKRKNKSDNYINTENDNQKTTQRKLQAERDEDDEFSSENKENIKIEDLDKKSEDEKKIKAKINKEYRKYKINEYPKEGSNSNDCGSLGPNKLTIILRAFLYNVLRPIYLYLLLITFILFFKSNSDLENGKKVIAFLIYLIPVCTCIIIECVEEIKGQNRLIFFNEKIKYQKITDDKVLKIPGRNIQRGDIIIVNGGDPVPCDMIIVDSSVNTNPLYFSTATLTGNFNYSVRLIKKNIIQSFSKIKNIFKVRFTEFFKEYQEKEKERMKEEENRIPKSHIVYEDFLERNGIMTQKEEDKRIQEENRRILNQLKFNQTNKLFEKLKFDQYFKFISKNLFKGNFYLPKDMTRSTFYVELSFKEENDNKNKIFEINQKNICYLGEKVKNAKWFMGIAMCVADESKPLRENSESFNSLFVYFERRQTYFEKEINYYFFLLLIILVILSAISGIIYAAKGENSDKTDYIDAFFTMTFKYFSIMHTLIPYSFFFVLEIVLLFQKYYINTDIELINKNGTIIKDSKKIKDLGKVDLILTNQSGTLTKNERNFRYCVIAEGCYEYRNDGKPSSLNSKKNYKKALTFKDYDMLQSSSIRKGTGIIDSVAYKGYIVRSLQDPNTCYYFDRTEKLIEEFWKGFALCHDAVPVYNKNNLYTEYYLEEKHKDEIKFFSNDEDDSVLVEIAAKQGFTFYMDEKNTSLFMGDGTQTKENNKFYNFTKCDCEIIMGEYGEKKEKLIFPAKKLGHLKLTKSRKRESVIVKEQNLIKLFVKGPIEEVMSRIVYDETPKQLSNSMRSWIGTVQEETGNRAFILGMRVLTYDEYKTFVDCCIGAYNDDIDTKIRINAVIDSLESNLTLLGACFIEDIYPNKISHFISNLKSAGIKIWNLTGDKVNIAYNIGLATGIINPKNETIIAEVNQEALLEMEIREQRKEKELNNLDGKLKTNENNENKEDNEDEESDTEDIESDDYYNDEEYENKKNTKKVQRKIEKVLKAFKDEFKKMEKIEPLINYTNKFDIVIDSLSFREILKNPLNVKSFFDKAILANSLTFCEFTANDKRDLVKHFKNYIKDIKNITSYTILGIGNGFNDIGMLRECDISVGINNGINKYTSINVDKFMDLPRLILFHGLNNLKRNVGILELIITRHFIFGFIFFLYGCHIYFSNIYIISTESIYLSLFVLNLFGPFLKGVFDLNLFYFYDKKEKIENIENINELEFNTKMNRQITKNKDKENEYVKELKDKQEQYRNRMFKRILDKAFKYVYYQKNLSLVESGSEHVPYKKFMTIKKFIVLVVKSMVICVINYYITYGTSEVGRNIVSNKGDVLYFDRLQVALWTNHTFVIFIENEIFTNFYTIYRVVEIILFFVLYIIIYFTYPHRGDNEIDSFPLFLNFLLVVSFCSLINFGVYIVENLFDGTIIYKLRNMKQSDKHLEEMKELVNYKDEDSEEEVELEQKEETKINDLERIEEVEEVDDIIGDIQTITEEISAIKSEDTKSKVVIKRIKNKSFYNVKENDENEQMKRKLDGLFDRYLIKKKEIKDRQVKDTIDSMNNKDNVVIKIKDDNRKKKKLKYVED